jgi:hypothetical protein
MAAFDPFFDCCVVGRRFGRSQCLLHSFTIAMVGAGRLAARYVRFGPRLSLSPAS